MKRKVTVRLIPFALAFAVGVLATYPSRFPTSTTPEVVVADSIALPPMSNEQSVDVPDLQIASGPKVAQSADVAFSTSGLVTVKAVEEDGKFPQMVFVSKRTGKTLLRSTIIDSDKYLRHEIGSPDSFPQLRFRAIGSGANLVIMSVGIYHGGSDNGYYLTMFAERDGRLQRLNNKTLGTAIQGGYYFGSLNKRFGTGLVVWSFIWGDGIDEGHYSDHHYLIEIYKVVGNKLVRSKRFRTKHMYQCDKGSDALRELGIEADDQRRGIPLIEETLDT